MDNARGAQEYTYQGVTKTMVWQEVPLLNWRLVLFIDNLVVYAPLAEMKRQIFLFVTATLVIFVVLTYIISMLFVQRILKVSLSLKEISEGEGDLTQSIKVKSRDELTQLTINFNNFIEMIRSMIANIKESADSTLMAKDTLVANTEETAAAVNEINATMHSMEQQIERLDESISNSARSVNSINDSVESFNGIREEQAIMVEKTADSLDHMLISLEQVARISREKKEIASQLTETSRQGGDQLSTMSQSFNEKVVTRLGSIEDMTDIIRGIADQINLLSMNAAIEAAHAGDAGKGFAVVADEIRKLAESSSESVTTIDRVITEIRNGVDDTVRNSDETARIFHEMDGVVTDFVNALNQIAESTGALMSESREIGGTAEKLHTMTLSIKEGAATISEGTGELNREMDNINDVSKAVLDGIQEAVVGAREIVQAMDQVTTLSAELAHTSEDLKERIDRFKTDGNP